MAQSAPDAQDASESFPRHLCAPHSLLLAFGLCLAAVGLALYVSYAARAADLKERTLLLLDSVRIGLNEELRQTQIWAERAAELLTGTTLSGPLVDAYSLLWPNVRLSFYDQSGNLLGQKSRAPSPPEEPSGGKSGLIRRAATGAAAAAFINVNAEIRLIAAARTADDDAHIVLVSHPLSPDMLSRIKSQIGADIAVLAPDLFENFHQVGTFSGIDASPETLQQFLSSRSGPVFADIPLGGRLRPAGITRLDGTEGTDTTILVVAPQKEKAAADPDPASLTVAATAAFCLFLLLSYAGYRREKRTGKSLASDLKRFILRGTVDAGTSLPVSLYATLREIRADLAAARALAGKALEERNEARRMLEKNADAPARQDGGGFRTFFEDAQTGFFLMRADGDLLQVNQSFALLLGYESPAHITSEKTSLPDLFSNREEAGSFLSLMQEFPGRSLAVTLRRRDGVSKNFTALSLRPPLEDENGLPTIAGAITDRSLEEQNIRLRQECAHMHRHNQDLALFFAAVCRQVQSHLFPYILNGIRGPGTPPRAAFDRKANGAAESGLPGGEGAGEGVQPDAAESPRGQEQIIRAHQSAFEDIYRISLAEAENSFPAPAPMDFMQILEEVFLQVLPLLHEQGTALFCEVDRNIDPRVYGFDLILRHTLVRALLNVAGPMRGGRAFLGLALAPNALPYDSSGKIQFTLSWDAGPLPDTGRPGAPGAEAPPPDVLESNPTGFSQREEHDILRFLVDKMQGELLPPAFSASARSICFLVRFGLEAMPSFSSLAEPLPGAKANLSPDAEGDPFSPATASVPPPATAGIAAPEEDLFPPETGDADHPSLASLAGLPGLLAPDSPQSLDLLPSSPVADAAEAPLDILIPDEQTVGPETVQDDSLNLLLIDANLNDRLLFSSCLRGTRHRVTEAHDGLQGVEAFQNQDFDVIFMDMEMPLMDGYQATRVIRALEADVGRRLTPIVAFTPQILPEFKYQCMLAGCTDFLLKPFNQASLLAMIHGFSREKRALSLPERETS